MYATEIESYVHDNIEKMNRIIGRIAKSYINVYDFLGLSYDDFFQEGWIVVLECINTFDSDKNIKFETWIQIKIRYHFLDWIRSLSPYTRKEYRDFKDSDQEERLRIINCDLTFIDQHRFYNLNIDDLIDFEKFLMVTKCKPRNREIIIQTDFYGHTNMDLARQVGMHHSRISQIRTEFIQACRRRLRRCGEIK